MMKNSSLRNFPYITIFLAVFCFQSVNGQDTKNGIPVGGNYSSLVGNYSGNTINNNPN